MRITQQNANDVAEKLVQPKRVQLQKLLKEISDEVKAEYLKTVPASVLKLFKTEHGWLGTNERVQILNSTWHYTYINVSGSVPKPHNGSAKLLLDEATDKRLGKIRDEADKLERLISETKREIAATMLSLYTYAKVKDIFPEAYTLLPVKESKALMIDMNKLRAKLK